MTSLKTIRSLGSITVQSMRGALVLVIRVYQRIVSPLLGNCCRFYPSCSAYCILAIERHGCIKGVWLGVTRLLKCHPLHPGGMDPVPGLGEAQWDIAGEQTQ